MTDYVKSTNFTSKDSLPSGNALKIVKGTEFDTEFNSIATAVATKADLAGPALTGTPTAPTAGLGTNTTQIATTAFVTAADTVAVATAATAAAAVYPTKTGTGASGTWGINISGTANSVSSLSASQVGSAYAGNGFGAVGTYFYGGNSSSTNAVVGGTIDGASLVKLSTSNTVVSAGLTGTWRNMGAHDTNANSGTFVLWLRIS